MKNLKLTDKELELIKDMLIEKIRYKGVQKLMFKIQNEQLVKYLRGLTLDDEYNDCTDEFLIAESLEHNWVEQIKRSELTDTE